MTPSRSLVRAVFVGLSGGFLLAGVLLFVLAVRTQSSEYACGTLTPDECLMEEAAAREWARLQIYASAGLALLGVGLLLWMRSAIRRQGPPGTATHSAEGT